MDCNDFKRRLMTDPMDADPEFRAHARDCADCAAAAERALAFEAQLRGALAAEAGESPVEPAGSASRRWWLLGLLPLAGGLLWWALQLAPLPGWHDTGTALGQLAIEHVQAEPWLLETRGAAPVPSASARLLLRNLGVPELPLAAGAPTLRHAGRCRIGERDGAHLVMDGERGPVTALVMPAGGAVAPASVHAGGFDALLLRLGAAVVALVGEQGEPLRESASALGLMPPPSRLSHHP